MQIFKMQPDVGVVSPLVAFFLFLTKTARQKVGMPAVCGAFAKNSIRPALMTNQRRQEPFPVAFV